MCGLVGVLLAERPRTQSELDAVADIFTRLLIASEHRGRHATGVAVVDARGNYSVSKAPVPASQFTRSRGFRDAIGRLGDDTTCLMGHTRWPTRGSHLDNANNHPLVSGGERKTRGRRPSRGVCILTHNGHIQNATSLFHAMDLPRRAQVDSEIILRLAEGNLVETGIDPIGFAHDISRCRGKLSAVVVATGDPTRILLVKGNQPLEARYHAACGLVAYASESQILDGVAGLETGWQVIPIPPWRLVVADTRQIMPLRAYRIPQPREHDWRWDTCL